MNCALTFSSTGYPILDWVPETGETILLAVAGNGGGAKSSLEIGRLAALAALGQWDESYRRDEFRIPMPEEV
jgi:glycine/D-amino acid oxidase-like deaminating enzyme